MTVEARTQRGETIVTLRGCFDADALHALHDVLAELRRAGHVTLDFREVRLFHDSAVAMLARELDWIHPVSIVGLSEHHHRLMRYMRPSLARSA